MPLKKTDKGREALAQGAAAPLNTPQRRVLILADGHRSASDLMAMLGQDILPLVEFLLKEGYIASADTAAITTSVTTAAPSSSKPWIAGLSGLVRAAAVTVQSRVAETANSAHESANSESGKARTDVRPAAAATIQAQTQTPASDYDKRDTAATKPPTGSRRSLAASKMYVLDMLQLQRDIRMAECRSEIQCAQGEVATVVALLDAVRQFADLAAPSYAARVLARLDEILPEDYLPALRGLQSELTRKPVLAINNVA